MADFAVMSFLNRPLAIPHITGTSTMLLNLSRNVSSVVYKVGAYKGSYSIVISWFQQGTAHA